MCCCGKSIEREKRFIILTLSLRIATDIEGKEQTAGVEAAGYIASTSGIREQLVSPAAQFLFPMERVQGLSRPECHAQWVCLPTLIHDSKIIPGDMSRVLEVILDFIKLTVNTNPQNWDVWCR